MATELTANYGRQNFQAAKLMLGAVLLFSFVPLFIAGGKGDESPFFFNALWCVGVTVGCLMFLIWRYRTIVLDHSVISKTARHAISVQILWAIGNGLNFTLFTLSTQFIDISIAAVLLETWPIIFIVAMSTLFYERQRYRENISSIVPLGFIALVGFGFVITSEGGGLSFGTVSKLDMLMGVTLAILSAVVFSIGVSNIFNWGIELINGA